MKTLRLLLARILIIPVFLLSGCEKKDTPDHSRLILAEQVNAGYSEVYLIYLIPAKPSIV